MASQATEKEIKFHVDKHSICNVTGLVNYKAAIEISLFYFLLPFSDICVMLSSYLKLWKGLWKLQKWACAASVFHSRATRSQNL